MHMNINVLNYSSSRSSRRLHSACRSRFLAPIRRYVAARSLVDNVSQFSMYDVVQSALMITGPKLSTRTFSPNFILRTGCSSRSSVAASRGGSASTGPSSSFAATTTAHDAATITIASAKTNARKRHELEARRIADSTPVDDKCGAGLRSELAAHRAASFAVRDHRSTG